MPWIYRENFKDSHIYSSRGVFMDIGGKQILYEAKPKLHHAILIVYREGQRFWYEAERCEFLDFMLVETILRGLDLVFH